MSTKQCISMWRKELCEILSALEVRRCQFAGDVHSFSTGHLRETRSKVVRLNRGRLLNLWRSRLIPSRNQAQRLLLLGHVVTLHHTLC